MKSKKAEKINQQMFQDSLDNLQKFIDKYPNPQKGPCVCCGITDYPLSMGGPDICPKCDCGYCIFEGRKRRNT